MASGRTHAVATLLLAPVAGGLGYAIGGPLGAAICGAGCLSGLALSPDLDHHAVTWGMERVPIAGPIWQAAWTPYERALPHRSLHSHVPGWGTLLRVAYLLAALGLTWWLLYAAQATYTDLRVVPPPHVPTVDAALAAWWMMGLIVADTGHAILDFK